MRATVHIDACECWIVRDEVREGGPLSKFLETCLISNKSSNKMAESFIAAVQVVVVEGNKAVTLERAKNRN